ncbi:MAG: hypothetical protein QM627_01040 [Luteolibacter sp.]
MNPENLSEALEPVEEFVSHEAAAAKLEAGKDHAAQAARELKEAALLKAREVKETAVHKADEVRRRVDDRVQTARATCERRTREEPMKCLLFAFGLGFVVGFLARR